MRCNKIGCLPVVDDGKLVGIVTSYDFLDASARLFKEQLTASTLIQQTNYLLDQQLRQLEKAFLQEGGFTERLYQARKRRRQ